MYIAYEVPLSVSGMVEEWETPCNGVPLLCGVASQHHCVYLHILGSVG